MRLAEIPAEAYARDILPQTAELWAGRRNFETYVAHTLELARCGYGRRHYRTFGLYDGVELVASFKRYERSIHFGPTRLRAIGLGAVFTPKDRRGRGYASAMIAMTLDAARDAGVDAVYLFSDIRPQFYEELGFVALPSRAISLRADSLSNERVTVTRLEDGDWSAVARCFELSERARRWGFTRTPLVWEWIRLRLRLGVERSSGHAANLVVRRGRGIAAYVLGIRAPEHDAYVLDEFGFADAQASRLVAPLLRSAAGDLQRIVGWLPPDGGARTASKSFSKKTQRRDLHGRAIDP